MGAFLASYGIPSSQYYVYSGDDPFEIKWNGKTVNWGYHVAPLMQPYGNQPQIFDPSVNGGSIKGMAKEEWVSKFSGAATAVQREVVTPASCYVIDSISKSPRTGCTQTNFADASLSKSMENMPKFRIEDLSSSCSVLYTYLAGENTGFTQEQIGRKRAELSSSVAEVTKRLSRSGFLEGDPASLSCSENRNTLERMNKYVRQQMNLNDTSAP